MTVGKAMFRNAVDKFGHALISVEEEDDVGDARASQSELQTISGKLNFTSNRLEASISKLDSLNTKYAILDSELEDISTTLDSKINMLNDEYKNLKNNHNIAVNDLNKLIGSFNNFNIAASNRVIALESGHTELKTRVDNAINTLTGISRRVETLENS